LETLAGRKKLLCNKMKNTLKKGDKVRVLINGKYHYSTIKNKKGIHWRLTDKHENDCCNLWRDSQIQKV